MISLGKIFSKYTGQIRTLKAVYILNNLLNSKQLKQNKALYKKYGLKKSIYSSISSQDFPEHHPDIPWLDQEDAKEQLLAHPAYSNFSPAIQKELVRFVEDGYMILKGFFSNDKVNTLNQEIDDLLHTRKIDFNYTGRKIMESYKVSKTANEDFFRSTELVRLLDFVMGKSVVPFHTINFVEGSEQRAHSDSVHMATEPLGYLIAAWTALESVSRRNGTLFFYPKSHRLPYTSTADFPSGHTRWRIGSNSNQRYEDYMEQLLKKHQLERHYFQAEAGDVLIWHANLVHGGSAIEEPGSSRKSMVAHYFCEGVICYHELSHRPALLPS